MTFVIVTPDLIEASARRLAGLNLTVMPDSFRHPPRGPLARSDFADEWTPEQARADEWLLPDRTKRAW